MADQIPVVQGDTPQAVAYALLLGIAHHEKKLNGGLGTPFASADKAWVLSTYRDCLRAAVGRSPD